MDFEFPIDIKETPIYTLEGEFPRETYIKGLKGSSDSRYKIIICILLGTLAFFSFLMMMLDTTYYSMTGAFVLILALYFLILVAVLIPRKIKKDYDYCVSKNEQYRKYFLYGDYMVVNSPSTSIRFLYSDATLFEEDDCSIVIFFGVRGKVIISKSILNNEVYNFLKGIVNPEVQAATIKNREEIILWVI